MSSVKCRKGDPCLFVATITSGLDADYTKARFQVRAEWDESSPLLLSVDESDGITFDYIANTVTVYIGATKTDALPVMNKPREVASLLRLYNEADPDDRVSFAIPFVLLPDVIDDG